MATPETSAPPAAGPEARSAKTWGGKARGHYMSRILQPSSRPRRCPWHANVIERAARLGAWHATAILHAGTGAWDRARPTHDAGRRAVTVLPASADPALIRWPSIRCWLGDCGDLPTAEVLELARCLIDAGAEAVHMVGEHLRPSLVMRRARRGD